MRSQRNSQPTYDSKCWIDDLEVCKQSGVGFSTNQIYREDGNRQEEHPFEDRNFHCKFDDHSFLYGVFDGHDGNRAVDFCMQKMPAEILFGQLGEKMTDEEIKEVLRQAFVAVENGYMESLGDILAERASYDTPNNIQYYEYYKKQPEILDNIKKINDELSSGTATAIALIYNKKLYIANVGNCRVLLGQTDPNGVLKVVQLSVDHDMKNEDELLRLSQIGLNIGRNISYLGNQDNTRCLGNYLIKDGYKEIEGLMSASQEPIISEPDIIGGINLDESHRFLLLMSAGLYKAIEEALGTDDKTNRFIAQCVDEQFREQATITGVAQAVVDKVVRVHHDLYMSKTYSKREDITLLVRNFNYPMPNAIKSPTTPCVTFNPYISSTLISDNHTTLTSSSPYVTNNSNETDTNTSSSSEHQVSSDPNERIKAYVNFNQFYHRVRTAKQNGTLQEGIEI